MRHRRAPGECRSGRTERWPFGCPGCRIGETRSSRHGSFCRLTGRVFWRGQTTRTRFHHHGRLVRAIWRRGGLLQVARPSRAVPIGRESRATTVAIRWRSEPRLGPCDQLLVQHAGLGAGLALPLRWPAMQRHRCILPGRARKHPGRGAASLPRRQAVASIFYAAVEELPLSRGDRCGGNSLAGCSPQPRVLVLARSDTAPVRVSQVRRVVSCARCSRERAPIPAGHDAACSGVIARSRRASRSSSAQR